MRGKVEICGINTSKLQTLKSDEVTQLLRQAKDGDTQAREKLIYGNLRLVLSVVQKFLNPIARIRQCHVYHQKVVFAPWRSFLLLYQLTLTLQILD